VVREAAPQLAPALEVDVEQQVGAARQRLADQRRRGAIVVAVDQRVLGELVARDHPGEGVAVDEEVLAPVDLPRARGPRRVRDAELDLRELVPEAPAEGRLPSSRRT